MSGRAYDAIVLMGPPGSGKSHLGRALRAAGVCAYRELEPVLLARFGAGEAFQANKAAALAFIERSIRGQIARAVLPVAIETTGVSDAAMLRRLAARRRLLWVRLGADETLCAERIASRDPGRNLSNDLAAARRFHAFWTSKVAPDWRFDLTVDARDCAAAVAAIRDASRVSG